MSGVRIGARRAQLALVVLVLLVGAAACDWGGYQNGPDHTGFQPLETTISAANIASLHQVGTYGSGNGGFRYGPRVANGFVYANVVNEIDVYDARCVLASCPLRWKAPAAYNQGITVANGYLYVLGGGGGSTLYAYDALGSNGCVPDLSGVKTCSPLWRTPITSNEGPGITNAGMPIVANGLLYVAGGGGPLGGPLPAWVYAFDPSGTDPALCSGGVPRVCQPKWFTTSPTVAPGYSVGVPSVANGVLYITNNTPSDPTLLAFNANGCSSSPCAPLWTATPTIGGQRNGASDAPVVAGGNVLFPTGTNLVAYNALGCGSSTCNTPAWSVANTMPQDPAVANGVVYASWGESTIHALALDTGTLLWTASSQFGKNNGEGGSPAVANGVVYVGESGSIVAFNASGCGSMTCSDIWHAADCALGTTGGDGDVAISNGAVYVSCGAKTYTYMT